MARMCARAYICWHCLKCHDNVWQCMTIYATMYDIVWGMYDNAWAMYDKNGWRGIACRGSESQVPTAIDQHWHRGIPALHSSCALFQCSWWHCWASFLAVLSRSFLSTFSQINLLVTTRLFLLSLVAPAFRKEPLLEITLPHSDSLASLLYSYGFFLGPNMRPLSNAENCIKSEATNI